MPRFILETSYPVRVTYNDQCEPELWATWSPHLPDRIVIKIDLQELERTKWRVRWNRHYDGRPEPPPPWTGNIR